MYGITGTKKIKKTRSSPLLCDADESRGDGVKEKIGMGGKTHDNRVGMEESHVRIRWKWKNDGDTVDVGMIPNTASLFKGDPHLTHCLGVHPKQDVDPFSLC